jgi:hypothetical protein
MPTAELCFVLAPGQNHFFVEVVEALAFELDELGVAATVSREGFPPARDGLVYVLAPPHEFRGLAPPAHWPTQRQLERTIFYCFEQPGTKFFDEDVRLGKGPVGAVVDLNAIGVNAFHTEGVRAHHAPIGWTAAWAFPGMPTRDIDLLHLGSYSTRRGAVLARSADLLARWRTHLVLGDNHAPNSAAQANFTVDDDKWRLLSRSRVLLNIHAGERPYFEWLRVVQAVANGVLVVSEDSLGTAPLIAGEHFVSGAPEELVALAEPYLEDGDLRAAVAHEALEFLQQRLPLSASAELLAELAAEIARRPAGSATDDVVSWPDNTGIRAEVSEAAAAAIQPDRRTPFDGADDELVMASDPGVELFPGALRRLTAALEEEPTAAFAWGMVADDDASGLRNVFPWQPWRLADDVCYIERPVLWRATALSELGSTDGDHDLYRRAAESKLRGAHVPEIVGRRARAS